MTPAVPPRVLVGGIVAFEDGERVRRAIRSLREQALPVGCAWRQIWVVVAPDDVGTVAHARAAALGDPRVVVIEEPKRRGKSAALAEILRRAEGDLLVLLNGDAAAEPGAVAELVRAASDAPAVFGVMARPVPPRGEDRPLASALRLLWGLHDRFHRELTSHGEGGHLSDELMALPIANLPPFRPGIINDGAFAAVWIRSLGGTIRYARGARVVISLPARWRDHIEQRRRIRVGHRQILAESGRGPTTLTTMIAREPGRALRLIRAELREHPHPLRSLGLLVTVELLALVAPGPGPLRGAVDPAAWPRVAVEPQDAAGDPSASGAPG